MDNLVNLYHNLVEQTDTSFLRFMHEKVDWNNRLTCIVGARGTGKTTMLLQYIKLHYNLDEALYVNADDFYFADNRLFDLASIYYKNGGKHLFIDEIHKYPAWSKEIKLMYDYFTDLHIVFTGSSILDVYKGSDDLSRRALTYKMPGMSFREFLMMTQHIELPVYSLDQILSNKVRIPEIDYPLLYFKQYLKQGYYPFFRDTNYAERLRNIVTQTLETDIPMYSKMNVSTAHKLKQLMSIISQSVPFKPNLSKIAQILGIHRNQVSEYLYYLEKAGLIMQLRSDTQGIRLLGKVDKVYVDNPNLMVAVSEGKENTGNIRETFFLNQMNVNHIVNASDYVDFRINDTFFEIGGKGKNKKQIKEEKKAYIVKDDIEYGSLNIVPLWSFGFNY
ncbi:MAG: ATP-binding protein [Prolixibacteraceae bacterium]|nr:ATP-binding protein [Prolixibacteraceae bacterium]